MVNTAALHAANASSNLVKAIPLNFFCLHFQLSRMAGHPKGTRKTEGVLET